MKVLNESFERWFDRQKFKSSKNKELLKDAYFSGVSDYKKLNLIQQLNDSNQKMRMLRTLSKIQG